MVLGRKYFWLKSPGVSNVNQRKCFKWDNNVNVPQTPDHIAPKPTSCCTEWRNGCGWSGGGEIWGWKAGLQGGKEGVKEKGTHLKVDLRNCDELKLVFQCMPLLWQTPSDWLTSIGQSVEELIMWRLKTQALLQPAQAQRRLLVAASAPASHGTSRAGFAGEFEGRGSDLRQDLPLQLQGGCRLLKAWFEVCSNLKPSIKHSLYLNPLVWK